MPTKLSTFNLAPNAINTGRPNITSVTPMDSTYTTVLSSVSTSGGYIKIVGINFISNEQVFIRSIGSKGANLANSITHISSTELRVQLPASTTGTKMLWVVNNNGSAAMTTITYN